MLRAAKLHKRAEKRPDTVFPDNFPRAAKEAFAAHCCFLCHFSVLSAFSFREKPPPAFLYVHLTTNIPQRLSKQTVNIWIKLGD